MQKFYFILVGLVIMMCSCDKNGAPVTTQYPSWPEEQVFVYDTVDCSGWDIPAGSITVREALRIGNELGKGNTSTETYLIKGLVTGFDTKYHESGMEQYGNACFYIQDNLTTPTNFYGFQVLGMKGAKFTSLDQLKVGDFVVIQSKIANYNGTIETTNKGSAKLMFSTNKLAYGEEESTDTIDTSGFEDFPTGTITVKKALSIGLELASGKTTDQVYLIKGRVKKLNDTKNATAISQYGNIYFYIHDSEKATSDFYGYQLYGMDSTKITSADQVQVGDFVVIKSKIKNYNGTIETTDKGSAYIKYSTNPKAYL